MKNFWALPAFLRLALASQHAFNVHEDLLAFPQFDVIFPESYVTEDDATSLLAHTTPHRTSITSTKSQETQDLSKPSKPSSSSSPGEEFEYTYERVVVKGQRYLCSIPIIPDEEPQNNTASAEEAKAEKEKELVRATDRGSELLQGMQGNCIYYVSGWWSYSFCYMAEVKQFHQLQTGRDLPIYPPVEDMSVKSFILGEYSEQKKAEKKKGRKTLGNEQGSKEVDDEEVTSKKEETALDLPRLETKGASTYMVQHLSGGTECDLTGRDRKIEVQYHCHPSAGDRIAMIKEVSTCAYLMKIYTPRLCNDVAFLPPQDNLANHISCKAVLRDSEIEAWTLENAEFKKAQETQRLIAAAENNPLRQMKDGLEGSTKRGPIIGGTEVGAQAFVGSEGRVIEKSIIVGGGKAVNKGTVLDSEGRRMSAADLKKMGIPPATLDDLKEQGLAKSSGGKWRVDVVETPGGLSFVFIPEDEETDSKETKNEDGGKKRLGKNEDKSDEKGRGMGREEERDELRKKLQQHQQHQQQAEDEAEEEEQESQQGSEEVYKEEL
ncbi:unnamed protein product [Periconia digitata]|uniref:Endoplasmic reticulum lectin n=1 Tax=Periconia digitata TaxID=1303443 RepID=A0A9W4XP12_9PLEO|nr:unnamed protein product [Periconia digitata]